MRRTFFWFISLAIVFLGCQPVSDKNTNTDIDPVLLSDSLEQFTTKEFNDYATSVAIEYADNNYYNDDGSFFEDFDLGSISDLGQTKTVSNEPQLSDIVTGDGLVDTEAATDTDDSGITNVQEQGVDEGDIVKAHGGELKVETKEGLGSEFIIQLPA
jgi:hypothetical protein